MTEQEDLVYRLSHNMISRLIVLDNINLKDIFKLLEKEIILNTLILTDNNKSETAKKLNMSRTKLMYLLKKYNKEEVDKEIIKATEEEVKEATEKAVTQYKDVLDNLSKR